MRIIKSEWHQVEKRYALDIERDDLTDIYPDNSDEENDSIWSLIINNECDFSDLLMDANEQGIYHLEWDWLDEDDWWTDRKGGYEVTYSLDK